MELEAKSRHQTTFHFRSKCNAIIPLKVIDIETFVLRANDDLTSSPTEVTFHDWRPLQEHTVNLAIFPSINLSREHKAQSN